MLFSNFCLVTIDTFYDFTDESEAETTMASSSLSSSYGYNRVKLEYESEYKSSEYKSTRKEKTNRHMVVTIMNIDRYYSSVREEVSPLSPDATTLLDRQDWIGFFKACGPNYVRGIRRRQEITAIFRFEATTVDLARQYAASLKTTSWSWSWRTLTTTNRNSEYRSSYDEKYSEINQSLEITILGYGLGLNDDGSGTLVANSLEEYSEAMKYAFKSFTQTKDSYNVGMVYGIEVLPWVDNSSFQVSAGLLNDDIIIPVARSMIPKSYDKGGEFVCKNPFFEQDKNGYCCEADHLYDAVERIYNETEPSTKICRPRLKLDRALVKENMSSNAEYVARLDAAMRYRMTQLSVMEKCLSAANSYPEDYNDNILTPQSTVKYNEVIDASFSLMHLKIALDPLKDFGLVKHMAKELDEWVDMFYAPCLAALFGMNIDDSPDTETKLFMAYPWHTHDECMYLTCLAPNMRWDREDKGCVPSVVSGTTSAPYSSNSTAGDAAPECSKDPDSDADDVSACKHNETQLNNYQKDSKNCWDKSGLSTFTVDYFMNHFCMPQLTGKTVDSPVTRNTDCTEGAGSSNSTGSRRLVDESAEYEDYVYDHDNSITNLKKRNN